MAVVIRLQGLPLVAGSADIRRFFSGLNIPDGGVHIIGGEKGEAFIIFSTDEDARQAMGCSGGFIKDSRIQFFLSSKAEMQSIIEINRKRFGRGGRGGGPRRTGQNNSGTPDVGNLSNMAQVIKKGIDKSSHDSRVPLEDEFHSKDSRNSNTNISKLHFNQPRQQPSQTDRLYLFLRGIPYSSTEDDVFNFFTGLQVEKVLLLKANGRNSGDGLVKFATLSDAVKGMERDRNYMGSRFIVIRPSSERMWIKHGGIIEEKTDDSFHFQDNLNKGQYFSNTEHPKKEPGYLSSRKRTRSRTPPRRVVSQVNSRSPSRRITEGSYSKSPSQTVMAHAFSRSPQRDMAHAFSRSPQRDVAHAFSRSPQRDMAHAFSRSPQRDVAHAFSRPSQRDVAHAFSRSPLRDMAHAFSRSPQRDVAHAFSRSPQRDVAHAFSRSPQRDVAHTFSRSPQRDVAHAFSRSPQREVAHAFSRSPQRDMAHAFSRSQRDMAHAFSRSPQRDMAHTSSRSPPRRVTARSGSKSPRRVMEPMHSHSPRRITRSTHSRSPRRVKTHSHSPFSAPSQSHSPQNKEYYIYLKNLPAAVKKKDLREFFEDPTLANKDITFLKSHYKAENKDAIITFRSEEAYTSSLSYHKFDLFGQQVYIFPVSKKRVLESIGSSEVKRSAEGNRPVKDKDNQDGYVGSKTCVYVRNFPFDVTNVEVQKFFAGFNIDDNDIYLLYDDKGVGLGEALVKFRTENQARKAESLNRRCFLGTEVLLRCIPEEQMQEFGINISSASNEKMQGHHHSHERDEHFYSVDSQGHSVQEGDYRNLSDDFICTCDRDPQFDDGIPGNFSDSHFVPDSDFGGGSDSVTFIKLKNIPFRASPNEILDFFHGYKIIPESLSVQHNEYGMFSGEAMIALVNYKEAEAAINELNERPIGQRKVRLTFV